MADTNDLLKQLGNLIEEKLKAEREHTRNLFEAEREHTKQIVQTAVQSAKDEIVGKMEKEAETTADLFHETWNRLEKLNDHETRISQLEEEQLRTHKN